MIKGTSFQRNNDARFPYSILIMNPQFLPGIKGGGPVIGIANMVDQLGNEYKFLIITSNRDLGQKESYLGIESDRWIKFSKAEVVYLSTSNENIIYVFRLLRQTHFDLLFLNGVISRLYSMFPIFLAKLGLLNNIPIIISPRGELSSSALMIKRRRKQIFLSIARFLGLYKNCKWQVSSIHERNDLIAALKLVDRNSVDDSFTSTNLVPDSETMSPDIFVINDLPTPIKNKERITKPYLTIKDPGKLKIIFLSRISQIKNLLGALDILRDLVGEIQFHIYGPIEDIQYWDKCKSVIDHLPRNIVCEYFGEINHEDVHDIFKKYHLLFFPTFSESYGHVIIESLAAGCPVLISDQTPWKNLEDEGVGWVISNENSKLIKKKLQNCVEMNATDFKRLSQKAMQYGLDVIADSSTLDKHRKMFSKVIESMR